MRRKLGLFWTLTISWVIVLMIMFKAAESLWGITYTWTQFLFFLGIVILNRVAIAVIEDVSGY